MSDTERDWCAEYKQRILDLFRKEYTPMEDGYLYWFPEGKGGLSSHILRWIADDLDEQNAPWDRVVQEDMEKYREQEDALQALSDDEAWPL